MTNEHRCSLCGTPIELHARHTEVTFNIFSPTAEDPHSPLTERWCMDCKADYVGWATKLRKLHARRSEHDAMTMTEPPKPYMPGRSTHDQR